MLTNSVGQEIRCNIAVMPCICCVMSGDSAGNTQMAQGLKSSGSFLPHMFGACLGWLRWAGTLDKRTDMWTLCSACWLDSEKEQAGSKRSNRAMLQDNFLAFPDLVPAVTSATQIQGERKQSPPLAGDAASSHWRRARWVGDICTVLIIGDRTLCHALAFNKKGIFLAQTSLLCIQAILQSRVLLLAEQCKLLLQLMVPQLLRQGQSGIRDHAPATTWSAHSHFTHISWLT